MAEEQAAEREASSANTGSTGASAAVLSHAEKLAARNQIFNVAEGFAMLSRELKEMMLSPVRCCAHVLPCLRVAPLDSAASSTMLFPVPEDISVERIYGEVLQALMLSPTQVTCSSSAGHVMSLDAQLYEGLQAGNASIVIGSSISSSSAYSTAVSACSTIAHA